jgi:hypothetical protein
VKIRHLRLVLGTSFNKMAELTSILKIETVFGSLLNKRYGCTSNTFT